MPDPNQQRSSNVALSELPAKTTDRLSRIAISQAPATSQRSIPFYKPPGLSRVSQVTGGPPSLRQQTPPPHQSSPTKNVPSRGTDLPSRPEGSSSATTRPSHTVPTRMTNGDLTGSPEPIDQPVSSKRPGSKRPRSDARDSSNAAISDEYLPKKQGLDWEWLSQAGIDPTPSRSRTDATEDAFSGPYPTPTTTRKHRAAPSSSRRSNTKPKPSKPQDARPYQRATSVGNEARQKIGDPRRSARAVGPSRASAFSDQFIPVSYTEEGSQTPPEERGDQ